MKLPPSTSDADEWDPEEIAEKVKTGEFFRESLQAYHRTYHDPMVERYFYGLLTVIAFLILIVALFAANSLFPLKIPVPFIYNTADIVDDLPVMKPLGQRGADHNTLLKQFLAGNYVGLRENYNINLLERNANGVRSQSTEEVFDAYQRYMDPRNPESPISQYQRRLTRQVNVTAYRPSSTPGYDMDVEFEAKVTGPGEIKKTRWIANIAFRFSDIQLDEQTGKYSPLEFVVTAYQTRRVQDS